MATFEEIVENGVKEGDIPGIVLLARDRDGKFDYSRAFGCSSLKPGDQQPMKLDTVLRLASCTKLLTTISCLQAVDRGLVKLDDDVSCYIPSLATQDILTGFAWYGKPRMKPRSRPITLRHLLLHTAGTGYDFFPTQPLWRYRVWNRQAISSGCYVEERFTYPLLHEPGEGWTYGSGASWAGKVLEEISGMSLESWMNRHISEPLGLTSLTFFPFANEAVSSRLATVSTRDELTGKFIYQPGHSDSIFLQDCLGGEGAHASLEDFMAILQSLLMDDEKLLSKSSSAMMFTPQLTDVERKPMRECIDQPNWICTNLVKKAEYDWSLGGVLVDGDGHEFLSRGTLMWSGLYHIYFWVDRRTGCCGAFGAQVYPGTDKVLVPLIGTFQKEMYARLNQVQQTGFSEKADANSSSESSLFWREKRGKTDTAGDEDSYLRSV